MAIHVSIGNRLGRLLFWLAIATITVLSLLPLQMAMAFSWQDKVEHAIAYACLLVLAKMAYTRSQPVWMLALALLGYGVLMEFAQSLTPYRTADIYDVFADATGLIIAWALLGRSIRIR